jgi:cellulose synthase/poly-beta-1,6-N-acetylglucosamine synthase-like glycosyltransferase
MWDILTDGFAYLTSQSWQSFIALFWFVILFELPRYTMTFMTAGLLLPFEKRPHPLPAHIYKLSVVIAGHNEADAIERCLLAVRELRKRGLVSEVHSTGLRAGKSAATNLGIRRATGDIIINIDCDCTLDRFAFERACDSFSDPEVGAVAGNIVVRNAGKSFITGYQAVEYLVILSLGKRGGNITDQVTCASGAFGAFRRQALDSVAGLTTSLCGSGSRAGRYGLSRRRSAIRTRPKLSRHLSASVFAGSVTRSACATASTATRSTRCPAR